MSPKTLNLRRYDEIRASIPDGALLLFRGTSRVSRIIQRASRGSYSHAGIAVWARGVLLCCENREFRGGRAVTLRSQVHAFPGLIDCYRLSHPTAYSADQIDRLCQCMLRKGGNPYGWRTILRAIGLRTPIVWHWVADPTDDEAHTIGLGQDCSESASDCYRATLADPVPNLSDVATDPSDLSRSQMFSYFVSLEP